MRAIPVVVLAAWVCLGWCSIARAQRAPAPVRTDPATCARILDDNRRFFGST